MSKGALFSMIAALATLQLACDLQSFLPPSAPAAPVVAVATIASLPPTVTLASVGVTPSPVFIPTGLVSPSNTSTPASSATPAIAVRKIIYSVCDRQCTQPESAHLWIVNGEGGGAFKVIDRAISPSFAPDGLRFVFQDAQESLYTINNDGGNRVRLVNDPGASVPDWDHDGKWIVYATHARCPNGPSSPVGPPGRRPPPTATREIPRIILIGMLFQQCVPDIVVIAPDGTGRRVVTTGDHPTWSPDDTQIAYDKCEGSKCGIFVISAIGGTPRMVTDDVGSVPHWSPDGKRILYQTDVDGVKQIFIVNIDGSGKKQVTTGKVLHVDGAWSLNGGAIYYRSPELGSWDVLVMNPDGTNPRKILGDVPPVDWANEKLSLAK